ncbi:MAG: hypothetical protein ACOYL8_02330 [Patescibacteria group bacterium]
MNKYDKPIAKLGKRILIAKESDISKIGTEEAMEVLVEQWDMETKKLEGEFKLEQLLKFNPWEDLTDPNEIKEILIKLNKFKDGGEQNREMKMR